MDITLQNNIEKWLSSGEKVFHFREKLHTPSETAETNAETAFQKLYYHIAELDKAKIKEHIGILNKRRSNISDKKLKEALGDFLGITTVFADSDSQLYEAVAFMKKEGTLPHDDSEARRLNEERLRKAKEEAERRHREEQERRRREQEQLRQREAEDRERRRREEESRQQVQAEQMEAEVDALVERMKQYTNERINSSGKFRKFLRTFRSLHSIIWIIVIIGLLYILYSFGVFGAIGDWFKNRKQSSTDYALILPGSWSGNVGDAEGTLTIGNVRENEFDATIIMQYRRVVTHRLHGTIDRSCDSLHIVDLEPDRYMNGTIHLHIEQGDEEQEQNILNGKFVATKSGNTIFAVFNKNIEKEVHTSEDLSKQEPQKKVKEIAKTEIVEEQVQEKEKTPLNEKTKEDVAPENPKEDATIPYLVDQMPTFPGGRQALIQYLSNNIIYPAAAEENHIEGRVILSFIVERDGSITDINVVKGVNPLLNSEAQRVVRGMPHWIPGKHKGETVRVKFNLPVTFKLN